MPILPRTNTRRKSKQTSLSTVDIPPGYRNAIRHAGLSEAQTVDLLNDAHTACTLHGQPIKIIWHGIALCETCIEERYGKRGA